MDSSFNGETRQVLRASSFFAFRQGPSGVRCSKSFCNRMREPAMPESVNLLMLEFLAWIDCRPRAYAETMEAWRSTCPRHPVWDDALVEGLIRIESAETMECSTVSLTPPGKALLDEKS